MKKILNLFVLDASSSMNSIKQQIIEGYNKQLQAIKESSGQDIDSRISLVTFSGQMFARGSQESVHTILSNKSVYDVNEISDKNYRCEGSTPLYDAIGLSIKSLDKSLGDDLRDTEVIVTVLTDGEENSSVDYTGSQISDLIQEYKTDHKWIFNFIGANIDVEKLSNELNIPKGNTISFTANSEDTARTMDSYTRSVSNYYVASRAGGKAVEECRANFMSET